MITLPNVFATDLVEIITGVLTVIGLVVATIALFQTVYSIRQASQLASEDRKAALQQAKQDLRWRQTVEAQRAIRRMLDDKEAFDAMTMLDWDGQEFLVKGRLSPVTHAEIKEALAPTRGAFTDVQAFIRDKMDALLANFELIQQGIEARIFTLDDVAFPIDYYIEQIYNNIGLDVVKAYIYAFNFPRSGALIDSILHRRDQMKAHDRTTKRSAGPYVDVPASDAGGPGR